MSLVGYRSSNHPQQVAKRGATERDNLGTDPALFAKLDKRFHFTLDVCAIPENAKCSRFFTKAEDGLTRQSWTGERVWCNPPYSEIRAWVQKAWWSWAAAGRAYAPELIVMLLPANRTEQGWWQDLVEPYRCRDDFSVEFLRGRQRFVLPGAEKIGPNERPPFGCCLLIWEGGVKHRFMVEVESLAAAGFVGDELKRVCGLTFGSVEVFEWLPVPVPADG